MHVLTAVILSTCGLGGAPAGELLDFSAKWCGPCQQMSPIVDRLHRQGYPIRKVDVDENRELARKYHIQPIPAFVLVINGKVVDQRVGMQSERDLLDMLARIPKPAPEVDPARENAPIYVNSSDGRGKTMVIPPAAPKTAWGPAPTQRGILPNLFGRGSKNSREFAGTDIDPKTDVRGKLDDQSLNLAEVLAKTPLQASIRIRVISQGGTNLGSGTVIQSKTGHTVILTCGHVFRDVSDDCQVEVDVFQNGKKEVFVGKHMQHDLELDLGLISIATDNPLPYSLIGSQDCKYNKGDAVVSVGCGGGNDPSEQKHLITRVNRYKGPSNIECTGIPVQGQSGGGLFNTKGDIIGVCRAADEQGRRGLYVGLPAIQGFLKTCGLNKLLKGGTGSDSEGTSESGELIADESAAPAPRGVAALQAALGEDAEGVVCVVKSRKNSQRGDRVIVLPGRSRTDDSEIADRRENPERLRTTAFQE